MGDFDLPVEDDDSNCEQRIEVPHKNDLDLGRELVFEFVDAHLPRKYGDVSQIFRRQGAYGRYKALLDRNGLLQTWYDYENSRTERKIREWCERNGIELEGEQAEKPLREGSQPLTQIKPKRIPDMEQATASERAANYFRQEYLCSQAVLMAFAPQLGLELQMASKIAAPFGAGIGRLGKTCGAVSGALMVIGLKFGHETADDTESKELTFELTRKFLEEFESRNENLLCRELLGLDISNPKELELARNEGVFDKRCPKFVRDAAEIVEEILNRD